MAKKVIRTLEDARILMAEGFTLDAKKALIQLLIKNPSHIEARAFLDSIYEMEKKSLFESPKGPSSIGAKPKPLLNAKDFHEAYQSLEDLLAPLDETLEWNAQRWLPKLLPLGTGQWMDLATAFFMMDLWEPAIYLLKKMKTQFPDETQGLLEIQRVALLGQCYVAKGDPEEAKCVWLEQIHTQDVPAEHKCGIFYLLGKLLLSQGKHKEAQVYLQKSEGYGPIR